MDQKHIVALEIGSSKIKGALGLVDDSGNLTVLAVEEQRLVDSVRYGVIRNVEKVAKVILQVLTALERRTPGRTIEKVYVAIGGRSVISRPVQVERMLPEETEITPGLLDELRQEALVQAPPELDVITAAPRRFIIDRLTASQPVGEVGRDISAVYSLILCQNKLKKNIERALCDKVGLDINGYIVRQIAEANLVLSQEEKRMGCMFVDFGAETTTVSIYRFGMLQYLATLPMGSRNITRDIMSLTYLEEQAEQLKCTGGRAKTKPGEKVMVGGIDFSEINNYVGARALEIILNIQEQLKYAEMTAQDLPAGIIIVGKGAKLSGFNEKLDEITGLRVRLGMPATPLRVADGTISPGDSLDVMAVLAEAAADPSLDDCLTPEQVEEPIEQEQPQQPQLATVPDTDQEPDPEPEPPRPARSSLFGRIRAGMARIVSGPDDDDDLRDDE